MLNIFQSARVKLTLWYVLIIATISGVFSVVIYRGLVREIERGYHQVEARFIDEKLVITPKSDMHNAIIAQNIKETKQRVQILLLYANGIILLASGAISYYLAGQSLIPIQNAMTEQKRFIEDASHELKTPLAALKINIEVALRNKRLSIREAGSVLRDNLLAVNSLQLLTEDMLRLARYNQKPPQKTKISVSRILTGVVKSLEPLAKQKKISIRNSFQPFTVASRETDLHKLFSTIIDNAIAYTPKGGSVSVTAVKKKKTGEITVTDTGIGISKKDMTHIFDRFYRADQARTKQKHNGYGLGLPIAQQIARQYAGTIEIKSKEEEGTSVKIIFPLA